jgi:hypothetical protein
MSEFIKQPKTFQINGKFKDETGNIEARINTKTAVEVAANESSEYE